MLPGTSNSPAYSPSGAQALAPREKAPISTTEIPPTYAEIAAGKKSSIKPKTPQVQTALEQRIVSPPEPVVSKPAPVIPEINDLKPVIPWGTAVEAKTSQQALRKIFGLPRKSRFRHIGSGSTADVKKATIGGRQFAVKISKEETEGLDKSLFKNAFTPNKGEICGLTIPHHPGIMRTHALLLYNRKTERYHLISGPGQLDRKDASKFAVRACIQELVSGKELFKCLEDEDVLPSAELAVTIGLQVCDALMHFHKHGFIYRDLKPENLLYDKKTGTIKLVDIGFLKPLQIQQTTKTRCGTPEYVAPEVILGLPYNHKADNASFGVLLYELTTGNPISSGSDPNDVFEKVLRFSNLSFNHRKHRIKAGSPDEFDHHTSLVHIIARLTEMNPERRMTLQVAITALRSHQRKAAMAAMVSQA